MCLILTLVMLFFSAQNLMLSHWLLGSVQLLIALFFAILLIRNIRITHCERKSNCESVCILPAWLTKLFKKKDM